MSHLTNETSDLLLSHCVKIQQHDEILKSIEQNLALIQERLSITKKPPEDFTENEKDTLSHQLACDVSSVVGLKEAITWKSKFLKSIWTIALCVGVAMTAYFLYESLDEYTSHPTASKVEIVGRLQYDYPPIVLCPNVWLDAEKALSLGLSLEGLKYSLGYVNVFDDKVGPDNDVSGRQEFYSFYEKNDFESFDDYLMNISHDVYLEQTEGEYNYSTAQCSRCNTSTSILPKVVAQGGVCYNFRMLPENGKRRLSLLSRTIGMQIWDRSRGLIAARLWELYISKKRHLSLKHFIVPSVILKEFMYTMVNIYEEQVISQSKPVAPCCPDVSEDRNFSTTLCIANCLLPLYNRILNCTPFEKTVGKYKNHPGNLCNSFDNSTKIKNRSSSEQKESVLDSDAAQECYDRCPYSCDRTRYETRFEEEFSTVDFGLAMANAVNDAFFRNKTFTNVYIRLGALYQGGVLTYSEISTISFTSLVSNVGGTLGLFVGATTMTFVQIVLFVLKLAVERKKKTVPRNDVTANESKV